MTVPFLSLKLPRRLTSTSLVRKFSKFPLFSLENFRGWTFGSPCDFTQFGKRCYWWSWWKSSHDLGTTTCSQHWTGNLMFLSGILLKKFFVDWKNGRTIGLLGTRSFSNRKINRGKCQTHSDMLNVDLAPSRCHLEPAAESDLLSLQYFSHVNPTDTCYVRFLSFSWLLLRLLSNFIWK